MPMTYTDELVRKRAESLGVEPNREALAEEVEGRFGDYVEGWEIRSGKPWTEMSRSEAELLVAKHPKLLRNPGILSRLRGA